MSMKKREVNSDELSAVDQAKAAKVEAEQELERCLGVEYRAKQEKDSLARELDDAGVADFDSLEARFRRAGAAFNDAHRATATAREKLKDAVRAVKLAEFPGHVAAADPAPVRARILDLANGRLESKRNMAAYYDESVALVTRQNEALRSAVAIAKECGLEAPQFHPVPRGQIDLAQFTLETNLDWKSLAMQLMEEVRPGARLPRDVEPRAFVQWLAEAGPEAILADLDGKLAEQGARDKARNEREADAGRRIKHELEALRTREQDGHRLTDGERRKMTVFAELASDPDGPAKLLRWEAEAPSQDAHQ
jgi:hypothetical protein